MGEHVEIEKASMEKLNKTYEIVIYDVTDESKEITRERVNGLSLVGEYGDQLLEIVLNENIVGIAAMLSAGTKTKHAVRLATLVENMRKTEASEQAEQFEDMLTELMSDTKGGVQ